MPKPMSRERAARPLCLVAAVVAVVALAVPAMAAAAPIEICVPNGLKENVTSIQKIGGGCEAGYKAAYAPEIKSTVEASEHLYYRAEDKEAGKTPVIELANGTSLRLKQFCFMGTCEPGDLLIGNEPLGKEPTKEELGANNLVVGTGNKGANGEYDVLIGKENQIGTGGTAGSVVAGEGNRAEGSYDAVFGKSNKIWGGNFASIFGGHGSIIGVSGVSPEYATIAGGKEGDIQTKEATVVGGVGDEGEATGSVVVGGRKNKATGTYSAVLGGYRNEATATEATAVGGEANKANGEVGVIVSGQENELGNCEKAASVFGGYKNAAKEAYSALLGGELNVTGEGCHAGGWFSAIVGGKKQKTKADYEAIG